MTRNLSLFVLFVSLMIGTSLFFACAKVESDNTPPTIKVLKPLDGDTLFIYTDVDTILPVFSADFSDNEGLSSYTFRIRHLNDSIKDVVEGKDTTAYFYKNYQKSSIFGIKDSIVKIKHSFQIDTLITVIYKDKSNKSRPIWQGVYQLDASVMDMQGNITTLDPINVVIAKAKYKKKE